MWGVIGRCNSGVQRVELRSPDRADSVLAILRNHGLSQTQISKIVRNHSEVLQFDPDKTLLPKLEFFRSLGVSREELASVPAYRPQLLTRNLENRIVPSYDFLRSLLSQKNVVSILKQGSWIFVEGHSNKLAPNIEVLRESGMPQSRIYMLLAHHPFVFMRKPKELGQLVDEVKQMGFNLNKTKFSVGIKSIVLRYPLCMIMSEKKIMLAMELLVKKMGWPSRMIAKTPAVMCYSVEKRFIPRCSVVKVLLLKGLMEIENVRLGSVLVLSEKCFLEMFVGRYKMKYLNY